uniref:Uncharacterized protein n=1 Tax=Romanomermis culicivorax TaxID=13658 RepID=A0A915L565_ROMCU
MSQAPFVGDDVACGAFQFVARFRTVRFADIAIVVSAGWHPDVFTRRRNFLYLFDRSFCCRTFIYKSNWASVRIIGDLLNDFLENKNVVL